MFRVIFFVSVFIGAAVAGKEECAKITPDILKCCKTFPQKDIFQESELKECKDKFKALPNCDGPICIAKNLNYAGAVDGTFDKKALEGLLTKSITDLPEIRETTIKNCVNGDISEYGPPEYCDLLKLGFCFQRNLLGACSDWDTAGDCGNAKELIEKCVE